LAWLDPPARRRSELSLILPYLSLSLLAIETRNVVMAKLIALAGAKNYIDV
jgi:hypothetical protein